MLLYKSVFLREFPVSEGFIVWNGSKMEFLYLSSPYMCELNAYKEGMEQVFSPCEKALYDNGLLVPDESRRQYELLKNKHYNPYSNVWTDLQVMLTDACNIACVYCQIEKNKPQKMNRSLSGEALRKGLDLFLKQADISKATINFTGGEALLQFPLIKEAVEIINSRAGNQKLPRYVVNTNGLLLTDEHIEFFLRHKILVIVSLDGPEECHNLMRFDYNGTGTYQKVFSAVKRLVERGISVGLAAVAGIHNRGRYEDLVLLAKELGVSSLGINQPHHSIYGNPYWMEEMPDYVDELMKAFTLANQNGIFLEQPNRRIQPLLTKTPRLKDCKSCSSRLALMPDGKLAPCYTYPFVEDESLMDGDENFKFSEYKILAKWHERSTLTLAQCAKCPWVLVCGTGCTTDAVMKGGIDSIDSRYCVFTEKIMNWAADKLTSTLPSSEKADLFVLNAGDIEDIYPRYSEKSDLQSSVGH